jgi:hypothetical protein
MEVGRQSSWKNGQAASMEAQQPHQELSGICIVCEQRHAKPENLSEMLARTKAA